MVLGIIPQMARGAHGAQVSRAYILRHMVQMRYRQRVLVRIERLSRLPALLSAFLAFPARCRFDS